jgi:hypothetical protein
VDCVGFEAKFKSELSVPSLSASNSVSLITGKKEPKVNAGKRDISKSSDIGKKIDNKIFENLHIIAYVQITGLSCASCVRSIETGDHYLL